MATGAAMAYSATEAAAAEQPATSQARVAFVVADALTVKWSELDSVSLEVQNFTGDPIEVTYAVTPLRGENGPASSAARLRVAPQSAKLGPAGTVEMVLSRAPGTKPPPGVYTAAVLAYEAGGQAISRRQLRVIVPARRAEPKPLIESATVRLFRHTLRIDGAPTKDDLRIPVEAASTSLALVSTTRLGAIAFEDHVASVYWDGEDATGDEDGRTIGLRFSGLEAAGQYEGTIDLLPLDDKSGTVKLTVIYSDGIWLPLLVVLLGVLAGTLLDILLGVTIPHKRLRARLRLLRSEADKAIETFNAAVVALGKPEWTGFDLRPAVAHEEQRLEQDLAELRRAFIRKIPEERLDALEQNIEETLAALTTFAAFPKDLVDLDRVARALSTRPPIRPPIDLPAHVAAVRELAKLLTPTAFSSLKQYGERRASIQGAVAPAEQWRKLEYEVGEAQVLLTPILLSGAGDAATRLQARLSLLYAELLETTLTELASTDLATALRLLHREIRMLAGQLGLTYAIQPGRYLEAPDREALPDLLGSVLARKAFQPLKIVAGAARSVVAGVRRLANVLVTLVKLFASSVRAGAVAVLKQTESLLVRTNAYIQNRWGGWLPILSFVAAIAIASASGLSTEYAGKAFGASNWDYLKLFLWGLTTKVALDLIIGGLDAIKVSRVLRR